tara:strand:+ start:1959 stop:2813 length:855 start_codon:yes stop_codon:yes gene_type:complete
MDDEKHINGNKLSKVLRDDIKTVINTKHYKIKLAVILVGNNCESLLYIKYKKTVFNKIGIGLDLHTFDVGVDEDKLISKIHILNKDSATNGIMIQLPLPSHLDKDVIVSSVSIDKDVDGCNPINLNSIISSNPKYIPCTPLACLKILDLMQIDVIGKHVVVIGKSNTVGLPLALLLSNKKATVTMCDKFTNNIDSITRSADILISACGSPKLIKSHWIKEGVIVLDVGVYYDQTINKYFGDVDYDDVISKVSLITPNSGGVGPMTITMLLKNLLEAYESQNNLN